MERGIGRRSRVTGLRGSMDERGPYRILLRSPARHRHRVSKGVDVAHEAMVTCDPSPGETAMPSRDDSQSYLSYSELHMLSQGDTAR
jgi:hypothetical protein